MIALEPVHVFDEWTEEAAVIRGEDHTRPTLTLLEDGMSSHAVPRGTRLTDWLFSRPLARGEAENQEIAPVAGIPILGRRPGVVLRGTHQRPHGRHPVDGLP